MKNVLFLCVENSCRSQIAEGFARNFGKGVIAPFSAGSSPSGKVNLNALLTMAEAGLDLSAHFSKGVDQLPDCEWDYVITMGCGDHCPQLSARQREDWAVEDPKHLDPRAFRRVRDAIRNRVEDLIARCRDDVAVEPSSRSGS